MNEISVSYKLFHRIMFSADQLKVIAFFDFFRNCIMFIIIYFAVKSCIGDHVNTKMNDILRQLKITSTGIVKFLTGTQRNILV